MNGEVIFLRLTEVGRSINLKKASNIFPNITDKRIIRTKDTPSYVDFPDPLTLGLTHNIVSKSKYITEINLQVKLYEEGVISLIARINFHDIPLEYLHKLRITEFSTHEGDFKINQFLKFHFRKIFSQIKDCIEEDYTLGIPKFEKYTFYCIADNIEKPEDFLEKNKNYLAALLMGENPSLELNKIQVDSTLSHSFSFLKNDLLIFDFDRALIIDPNQDYEDILLVTEIANYQLLELRTLDYLLDRRLAIAEGDIRQIYFKSRSFGRSLNRKVGNLLRLRYDFIFLLENIENVSKLIGDYYLAQIYTNLAKLFQLRQWSDSIRHRLETIGDIYNIAQTNMNERFLLYVEILLSFIFIMEFIFLIFDFFR
ncbi:MAG: hypothetical protein ACFE8M_08555 [Candidatus Hermodarchaeota archaeon]